MIKSADGSCNEEINIEQLYLVGGCSRSGGCSEEGGVAIGEKRITEENKSEPR